MLLIKYFKDYIILIPTLESPTKDINIEAKGQGLALAHLSTKYFTTSKHELERGQLSAFNLEPRIEISNQSSFKTFGDFQRPSNQIGVLSCQR